MPALPGGEYSCRLEWPSHPGLFFGGLRYTPLPKTKGRAGDVDAWGGFLFHLFLSRLLGYLYNTNYIYRV